MTHYDYLIIGGGMAGAAAANGIRDLDNSGVVGILSGVKESPYDRPPLSKKLWTGDKQLEAIFRELPDGVELLRKRRATELRPQKKLVIDAEGREYTYDKLLIATGSTPRKLPFGGDTIIYYRTINDYRRLRRLADVHEHFAVIGGGFIGSEVAAALAMQGKQVTMIFPDQGIGSRVFPDEISAFLNGYYRTKGVDVRTGTTVTNVTGSGVNLSVELDSDQSLTVQGIVAGIGVTPNVALAEGAGLELDNGILVNDHLQTSDPAIYAAGDVAQFPDLLLGTHRRVEHEDAANSMGRAAGKAMAGSDAKYDHSPMFYSDLFDLGYEAVGQIDANLDTVVDWQEEFEKGVIYYTGEGFVKGVLLWNVWDKVDDARKLIASDRTYTPSELRGMIN